MGRGRGFLTATLYQQVMLFSFSYPVSCFAFLPCSHGFAPSDSEYGPLADLPDWSFADGRPGHPWKGQVRRQEQREQFARRVVMLHKEMDHGIRVWEEAQCQKSVQREEKRRQLLKPKGAQLPVKSKNEKWH
ncbi:39S ribosomal protein L52, mitochondrial isoform X2 [Rhinatrema bivittatum]|uniref:39S ribosomal protein L52, mitochondrial isoform X2 n=1 Tax=Rhinatrema bivittatum TaxID=194408 RepID=UPI0011280409|nr:39S ribosomal protein L52, mitochondrial isoform X2 [Rhinatrema bivittatum]